MADVVSRGMDEGWATFLVGKFEGQGGRFWWKNARCLRYRRQRGLPPSGVGPACPRCTWGLSRGRLGPVVPRALGHCVPVSQTVTQAGQGSGQGLAWGPVRMILILGRWLTNHPAPQTSPGLTQLAIVREQPGQRSRVAIQPTAVNQRDNLRSGPGARSSPAAAPGASLGH